jgi:DNA-binding transcriptional ArsR family regulator
LRHLLRCGDDGCRVGDLQRVLGIPASTLSHHLARLIAAGLVSQRREGILMKQRGMTEDEAYKALRSLAMNSNKRLTDVAESVVAAAKLLL